MMAPLELKSARWMWLAILVFAPSFALAQQDDASERLGPQDQNPAEAATALTGGGGTEEAQAEPEAAEVGAEGPQGDPGAAQPQTDAGPKVISGMSILGNQEAPTSLVIVPWKSSEIGNSIGISTMLDDSRQPVDKEVFMRALRYYEIRSETKP